MSTSLPATVYAESLCRYKHGHPLWVPEPSKGLDGCYREIQLGDVGYLSDDGGFRRLFNITVDTWHELNAGGVPEDFTPVVLSSALRCSTEDAINPGELCSEGVERVEVEGSIGTSVGAYASLDASYSFKCSTHRGAFLCLKDFATHEWIEPSRQLKDYIRLNHNKWHTFVTKPQPLGLDCPPEKIILVRGTMKTSSWTVGAFTGQTDRLHDFSAGVQAVPLGEARLRIATSRSESQKPEQRSGPRRGLASSINPSISRNRPADSDAMDVDSPQRDQIALKDQCIFLSYYKVKYRMFLPKKIEARAGSPSLNKDADDNEPGAAVSTMDVDIELETEHIPPKLPLDDLLDYILEYSNADIAIASDADIEFLYSDAPIPADFAATLRRRQPHIHVDGAGAGQLDVDAAIPEKRHNSAEIQRATERRFNSMPIAGRLQNLKIRTSELPHHVSMRHRDLAAGLHSRAGFSDGSNRELTSRIDNESPPKLEPESNIEEPPLVHDGAPITCESCRERDVLCDGNIPCGGCIARGRARTCKYMPNSRPTDVVTGAPHPLSLQADSGYSLLSIASRYPDADCIIPQIPYKSSTLSDVEVVLETPILFYTTVTAERCGIPCSDALESKFATLDNQDDVVFKTDSPSLSICLMWPGYPPWTRVIKMQNSRSPFKPITRAMLAKNVAKVVKRFIEDMENVSMTEGADPRYKVGSNHIGIDDLDLLGLENLSQEMWQAHLALRRKLEELPGTGIATSSSLARRSL